MDVGGRAGRIVAEQLDTAIGGVDGVTIGVVRVVKLVRFCNYGTWQIV